MISGWFPNWHAIFFLQYIAQLLVLSKIEFCILKYYRIDNQNGTLCCFNIGRNNKYNHKLLNKPIIQSRCFPKQRMYYSINVNKKVFA